MVVDPQRDRRTYAQLGGHLLQALQFFGGFDVEAVHAHFQGPSHVFAGLADAGENDPVGTAASGQYTFQLATGHKGHNVKAGTQAGQQVQHAKVRVGLDRKADQVRRAFEGVGIGAVLRLDMGPRVDIGGRAKALGNGGQSRAFREQFTVAVVESVHGDPLLVGVVLVRFALRGLGLVVGVLAVIRKIQWTFLPTGRDQASDREERSKGRDQALHGEILCKSIDCARVYRPPGGLPMRAASRTVAER